MIKVVISEQNSKLRKIKVDQCISWLGHSMLIDKRNMYSGKKEKVKIVPFQQHLQNLTKSIDIFLSNEGVLNDTNQSRISAVEIFTPSYPEKNTT